VPRIGIILGSTRPNLNGEQVARWVFEVATRRGNPIPDRERPQPVNETCQVTCLATVLRLGQFGASSAWALPHLECLDPFSEASGLVGHELGGRARC
jgi:hypothetical protein